jgi:thymidylate synthase
MVTELLWFLRGDTNIKYLVDNGCNIWTGDAYNNYLKNSDKDLPKEEAMISCIEFELGGYRALSKEQFINKIKTDDEFAKKWGELGKIYGKQWRSWENEVNHKDEQLSDEYVVASWVKKENIDQIANAIHLLKTDPDSRRILVSAWNPSDLPDQVLPPCHYSFQFYTRELSLSERYEIMKNGDLNEWLTIHYKEPKTTEYMDKHNIPKRAISLIYNARSQDVPLGTPFNISSYSLLLMMVAKQVNMVPEEVIANMGDCHIYLNQIESIEEQLTRIPYELPTLKISDRIVNDISEYTLEDFTLENYQYHPSIKIPLSN